MIYPTPEYISQRIERLEQQIEEDEALLRQALEILEYGVCDFWVSGNADVVITAIKERLK